MKKANNLPEINYQIVPECCYHIDLGDIDTFGIKVKESNYTYVLDDVSNCKEIVARMVELFNKYQLSSVHLKDVVEDMLAAIK